MKTTTIPIAIVAFVGIACHSGIAFALDAAGAEALARKSGCFKCHAIDKKKDGPPYKEISAKFKGKADAEAKLIDRLTNGTKVKIDGKEEDHDPLKTKDPGQIKDVVQWVLSQ